MLAHETAVALGAVAAGLALVATIAQAAVLALCKRSLERLEAREASTLQARLSAAYVALHRHVRVLRLLQERDGQFVAAGTLFHATAALLLDTEGREVDSAASLLRFVEELGAFWDEIMLLERGGVLPRDFFRVAGGLWAIRASHFVRLAEPLDIANGFRVNGRYWRPHRYAFCEERVAEARRRHSSLPGVRAHEEVLRNVSEAIRPGKLQT